MKTKYWIITLLLLCLLDMCALATYADQFTNFPVPVMTDENSTGVWSLTPEQVTQVNQAITTLIPLVPAKYQAMVAGGILLLTLACKIGRLIVGWRASGFSGGVKAVFTGSATTGSATSAPASAPGAPGGTRPTSTGPLTLGLLIGLGSLALFLAVAGCKGTTPQVRAYQTISSLENVAKSGVTDYYILAAKGMASTNAIPAVKRAYNQFQADCALAATISDNTTNALGPAQILADFNALTNVLYTAEAAAK